MIARKRPITSRHPAERELPWELLARAAHRMGADAAGKPRPVHLREITASVEAQLGITGAYQAVQRRMRRLRRLVADHAYDPRDRVYWLEEASTYAVAGRFLDLRRMKKIEVDEPLA